LTNVIEAPESFQKYSLSDAARSARHFGVAVEILFSFERFESIAMTLKRAGEDE
jgi:hypothetical protein